MKVRKESSQKWRAKIFKILKKKLDERTKDLESLSKDIADGINLDFEELGAKVNSQTSEIWHMSQQLKHIF